jgi:CRISPR-associated endonuclease/helicase Cas3
MTRQMFASAAPLDFDSLWAEHESHWPTIQDIGLLACMAALFHDFGKANATFQQKLTGSQPHPKSKPDAYRHEWVSLRLFEAFVRRCGADDQAWLSQLTALSATAGVEGLGELFRDGLETRRWVNPFRNLPPLAQLVGWLIVSHHRLPTSTAGQGLNKRQLPRILEDIGPAWCGSGFDNGTAKTCWQFDKGLPFDSQHWCQHVAAVARAMLRRPSLINAGEAVKLLDNPFVAHVARLTLMLADHHYSAQPSQARYGDKPGNQRDTLYANTERRNGKRQVKQRLDEHLIGVQVYAGDIAHALPGLTEALPRLGDHPKFYERSAEAFAWQNDAFALAERLREPSARQGFFGVNMASTGCGKTLANGRILYALADPQRGARFTVALGLRTLTLQTGDAYRERLHLGPEQLAVLVGGLATRALHDGPTDDEEKAQSDNGSESSAPLLPAHHQVHYRGALASGPLLDWLDGHSKAARLLNAPVLACTIDHLMPATEGWRGGHQIAPMLRLMTADLILDEPDDFGIEDLPALTRLVHWAGLLGSRVLLSSATLPPALVEGLFQAYRQGRSDYQRNRLNSEEPLPVCCAWFDEFNTQSGDYHSGEDYSAAHRCFVERRLPRLAEAKIRRRAIIKPLPIKPKQPREQICRELAALLRDALHILHSHHHSIDPKTGKRVSFGLIRMANIDPLFEVARELFRLGAQAGCRIHLCVYHSRHPPPVRAAIERELDRALKRTDPDAVFNRTHIRQRLDGCAESDHIFVVLATAVAEVGRDHDYDWAIVEPSSMRSFIQLAGRVRRHRVFECSEDRPNIYLLDTNIRHLAGYSDGLAFLRPGFENSSFKLHSHHLTDLLDQDQNWRTLSATARIQEREILRKNDNLADLEHARLRDLMLGHDSEGQNQLLVSYWWTGRTHLTGELQRLTRFRDDSQGRSYYALLPDEDERVDFCHLPEGKIPKDRTLSPSGHLWNVLSEDDVPKGPGIDTWATPLYLDALRVLAEREGMGLRECAEKYGVVDLPKHGGDPWRYHWALGFRRYRI